MSSIDDPHLRLIEQIEVAMHRDRAGLPWVVVTTFEGNLVNASGPYPTAEAALIAAQQEANDGRRTDREGHEATTYTPIPLFKARGDTT